MHDSVCLLSGGLDSSTLLFHLIRREGKSPVALSIFYGQRHELELEHSRQVAHAASVKHVIVNLEALSSVFAGSKSSQVGARQDVPEGHYAADNMAITVVPNRNMILLSVAGALAVSERAREIAYAAHAGDHAQYPDCREEFIEAFDKALVLANEPTVKLYSPFARWSKADIVRHGAMLGVPFGITRSCYNAGANHCGRCGTCVERAEAFTLAGVHDPTAYDDLGYWRTVCNPEGE